ncbi:MAG: hypothetical protein HWE20_14500, partial [Gammaproteobacteria bacterium]|nr:hypothetical protein [Gammaproteobacteria bacterium]
MDEMTQQNSALVEQAAAASESLEQQSSHLTSLVSFFKTDDAAPAIGLAAPAAARAAAPARHAPSTPAPRREAPRPKAAAAGGDGGWEEF